MAEGRTKSGISKINQDLKRKVQGLEKTENKEQSNWKLILTNQFQMPKEKVIHKDRQVREVLRDDM